MVVASPPCNCVCHKPGLRTAHAVACCENSGRKWVNGGWKKPAPVLPDNPTDEEMNEVLRWAKDQLTAHRLTHVEWRDWFRKHPDDPRMEALGDADFHNEAVQNYNVLLGIIEIMLETEAT